MSNVAKNDVTGDSIQTKTVSDDYRKNFDTIFRKTKEGVLESNNQPQGVENEAQKTAD